MSVVVVSVVSTTTCVQADIPKYCRYDFFRTLKKTKVDHKQLSLSVDLKFQLDGWHS